MSNWRAMKQDTLDLILRHAHRLLTLVVIVGIAPNSAHLILPALPHLGFVEYSCADPISYPLDSTNPFPALQHLCLDVTQLRICESRRPHNQVRLHNVAALTPICHAFVLEGVLIGPSLSMSNVTHIRLIYFLLGLCTGFGRFSKLSCVSFEYHCHTVPSESWIRHDIDNMRIALTSLREQPSAMRVIRFADPHFCKFLRRMGLLTVEDLPAPNASGRIRVEDHQGNLIGLL